METSTRRGRGQQAQTANVSENTQAAPAGFSAGFLAEFGKSALVPGSLGLAAIAGLVGYGISKPLYDLVAPLGMPTRLVNDLNNPFNNHAEAVAGLKHGEAGVIYSEKYDAYSLAVKDGEGVYYFSLLHDKAANPQIAGPLVLCETRVNRDFYLELNGVKTLILPAGRTIFKAVPQSYVEKMPRAPKA